MAKQAKTERNIPRQLEQLLAALARTFRDCYRKVRTNNEWSEETTFERKYAQHDLRPQYVKARGEHREGDRIRLLNEMCRSDWRDFFSSASVRDLRRIFQYFARKEGRAQTYFRPPRLDSLSVKGNWIVRPQQKAEALARHFAEKLSATGKAVQTRDGNKVRTTIRERYAGGTWRMEPPKT